MHKTDAGTIWSKPPDILDLQPAQVDVWRIALDLPPAAVKLLESVLSADERERAARFRVPGGRERYTVAHGCLRHILAHTLDCKPEELCFSTAEHGKPALQGYNLEFNLSHSGERALVAVSLGCPVGIDIERIRPDLELLKMADRFFSQSEVSELMALPPEKHQTAFFNCWARKEAYIKALGLGLSLPLDSFDVSLDEPPVLRGTRPNPADAAHWTLLSLEVEPGYAAAVAVEGQGLAFRLWEFVAPE